MQYNGATVGTFQFIQHIDVGIWGFKSVAVMLNGVQIKGNLTIATDRGADSVALAYSDIGGMVNVSTGPGDDVLVTEQCLIKNDLNIDTSGGADDVAINDNEVVGNLVLYTDEGDDGVDIRRNDVGGALVDAGRGYSNLNVIENWIRDDLSLMTGGSEFYESSNVEVFRNDVDSDVSITTGATNGWVYHSNWENRIKGDLSINIGDCGSWSELEVFENRVDHDTAITLGLTTGFWTVVVDTSVFRGNVTLDTGSSTEAYLNRNWFEGSLQVSTSDDSDDDVLFEKSMCDGYVSIDLGGGDDRLDLGYPYSPGAFASTFNGGLTVNGGAGSDTLRYDLLNTYGFPPAALSFETVIPF